MWRTLVFQKTKLCLGEGKYETIMDSTLIETILEFCDFYGLKVCKISLEDIGTSYVSVWGKKRYFLAFVRAFVHRFNNQIEGIVF